MAVAMEDEPFYIPGTTMTNSKPSSFPTALTIEGAVLRAHRSEAELLLRAGAILNAVQSSSRHVIRPVTTGEDRCDQLHAWIEIGSHLTKCHVVFIKRFNGLAWELVARGESKSEPFTSEMPVTKLRALFERDSPFMQACFTLRDKIAFHVDADPLLAWLDRQANDRAICLLSQGDKYVKDIISDGPLQMLDEEAQRAIDLESFADTLVHVVAALPRLVEAMCHGFVKKYALAVEFGIRNGHHVIYFYKP
jgi:hypothetical protein